MMIGAVVLALAIDAESIAKSFIAALSADSVPAFRTLAAADNLGANEWFSVRETIDRYRCPVIESYRVVSFDGNEIRVELIGYGTTENARRAIRPLPQRWILTAENDKLRVAETVEQRAARRFIDAKSDDERRRIVDESSENDGADLAEAVYDLALNDVVAATGRSGDEAKATAADSVEALDFIAGYHRRANDLAAEAAALRNISVCIRVTGDFPAAVAWGEASLFLATEANDCDAIANAQAALGEALRLSGSVEAGLALMGAAAYSVDTLEDPRKAIRAAHNYAIFAGRRHDFRQALPAAELALQKTIEYGWRWGEGGAWHALANLHATIGDTELSGPYYRRALATLLEAGNRVWAAYALANIANIARDANRREEALLLIEQAQELAADYRQYQIGVIGMHADILIELDRLAEAACLLEQTAAAMSDVALSSSNSDAFDYKAAVADLLRRQGRLDEAVFAAEEVRATAPDNPAGYMLVARALRARGRPDEARQLLEEAITIVEGARADLTGDALRRASFFGQQVEVYYELADLLVEQGQYQTALAVTELVKARAVTDVLTHNREDMRHAVTAAERRAEDEVERNLRAANQAYLAARRSGRHLAETEQALNQARHAVDRLQAELALRHGQRLPEAEARAEVDLASLLASPDLAVISYSVGKDATLVFAATRDANGKVHVDAVRVPITKDQLIARVEKVVTSIANRRVDYARGARAMYDLLVARVARRIGGRATLCIVPDGVLWELPFHALLDATGEPMIARYAMFYAPSLTMLRNARQPSFTPRASSLLALGDPQFDTNVTRERATLRGVDLGPLPETTHEVRQIAQLYPKHTVYTGAAAAEKRFKEEAPRHRVLHLATHGVMQDRWPLYSAVLLTPTDGEDGVVEAREILELELDADLAVLSACDTARGRIGAGEGMIGMSWALMMAGCRSTVVSQWKAASVSTAELMIAFHRELARNGRTKAEALRRAQLALRKKEAWRHPFYWAPFIVMGGGR
ncbi:MAG TPA: CHAT domain-containing protein [Thermoanaerobaculia bacterium]|nr:CHAT domain-containing protein [Thermoanaerobaculia bacterium]